MTKVTGPQLDKTWNGRARISVITKGCNGLRSTRNAQGGHLTRLFLHIVHDLHAFASRTFCYERNSEGQEVAAETLFVDHLTLLRFQERVAVEIKRCLILPGYWPVDKQYDDRTAVLGSPDRLWRNELRTWWFNLKVSWVVFLIVLPASTLHSLKLLCLSVRPSVLTHGTTSRSMEVIGSLLNFCDSTCIVNIMFLKMLGVFNLLCVIGNILLLTFWSLIIDVYIFNFHWLMLHNHKKSLHQWRIH
jgi:hypothetical protein